MPARIPHSFVISSNLVMTNTQAIGFVLTLFYQFHLSPFGSTRDSLPDFRRDQRSGSSASRCVFAMHPTCWHPGNVVGPFRRGISHPPSAIRHLSPAISPSPFPVPHSGIPHFLAVADPIRRRG